MKFRNMNRVYMEAASPDGGVSPVAAPAATPTPAAVAPVAVTPVPVKAPAEAPKATPQLNYKDPASKQMGTMLSDAGIDPVLARDAVTANNG
jgi:hypothetical protein